MTTLAKVGMGIGVAFAALLFLALTIEPSSRSARDLNASHGGEPVADNGDGYDPGATEVIHPYEISKNPNKWKGHSGVLDTQHPMIVFPNGNAAPVAAPFTSSIKFNRMIDGHTATYDVMAGEDMILPEGQIVVILPTSDPPQLNRYWKVLVEGPFKGTNLVGGNVTITAVKFEGYYDPPARASVPAKSSPPSPVTPQRQQASEPQSQEPTGVWPPLSHTAESITGQVILSSAGITIAGTTYPLTTERPLGPAEIQSLAKAFSLASGYQSVDARLYQTSIPANAVLLNGNRICGSEPARWIASLTLSSGFQTELKLMFLSGDVQPALNTEALENSTRVCGTYSWAGQS